MCSLQRGSCLKGHVVIWGVRRDTSHNAGSLVSEDGEEGQDVNTLVCGIRRSDRSSDEVLSRELEQALGLTAYRSLLLRDKI